MKNLTQILLPLLLCMFSACSDDAGFFDTSATSGTSGSITRFATLNNYMYTLNPNELQTFNISNPEQPVLVSELETDYGLETIFIYEGRIYIGARTGLYILGLSDPSQPVLLSQTDRSEEFFGACDPVVVKDNYAYSTVKTIVNVCGDISTQSALLVYEVSDPENPILSQTFELDQPNGLAYTEEYLYVCMAGANEIGAFDISDPANVVQRPDLNYPLENPFDIIVDGDRMIVSNETGFIILSLDAAGGIEYVKTIAR